MHLLQAQVNASAQVDAFVTTDHHAAGHADVTSALQLQAPRHADAGIHQQMVTGTAAGGPAQIACAGQATLLPIGDGRNRAVQTHPVDRHGLGIAHAGAAQRLHVQAAGTHLGRQHQSAQLQGVGLCARTGCAQAQLGGVHVQRGGVGGFGVGHLTGGQQADRMGHHLPQSHVAARCQACRAVGLHHRIGRHGDAGAAGHQVHGGTAGLDEHFGAHAHAGPCEHADRTRGTDQVGVDADRAAGLQQHRPAHREVADDVEVVAAAAAQVQHQAAGQVQCGGRGLCQAGAGAVVGQGHHLATGCRAQLQAILLAQEDAAAGHAQAQALDFRFQRGAAAAHAVPSDQFKLPAHQVDFAHQGGVVVLRIGNRAAGLQARSTQGAHAHNAHGQVARSGLQQHLAVVRHHLSIHLHQQLGGRRQDHGPACGFGFDGRCVVDRLRVEQLDRTRRPQVHVAAAAGDVGLHFHALPCRQGLQQHVAGGIDGAGDLERAAAQDQHQGAGRVGLVHRGGGHHVHRIAATAVAAGDDQVVAFRDEHTATAVVGQRQAVHFGAQVLRAGAHAGGRSQRGCGVAHDQVVAAGQAIAVVEVADQHLADGAAGGFEQGAAVGFHAAELQVSAGKQVDGTLAAVAHRQHRGPVGLQHIV